MHQGKQSTSTLIYVLLNMERINPNGLASFVRMALHGFQIDNRKERANDGLCTCKAEAPFFCALPYFLSFIPVLGRDAKWSTRFRESLFC